MESFLLDSSSIELRNILFKLGNEKQMEPLLTSKSDKLITFAWDKAGFSNTRMAVEIIFGISVIYNRTVVLPPTGYWEHMPHENCCKLEDFYDLNRLKAIYRVFTATEWFGREIKINEYNEYFSSRAGLKLNKSKDPFNFESFKSTFEDNKYEKIWYLEIRMFANLDTYFRNQRELISIRQKNFDGFKFKMNILEHVEKCLTMNGISKVGSFNAIHIRGGDFESFINKYNSENRKQETIETILREFNTNLPLLVISSYTDINKFDFIIDNYPNRVFFINCIIKNKQFVPLIDLISCTLANRFIGTYKSTYSLYIQILRGYLSRFSNLIDSKIIFDTKLDFDYEDESRKCVGKCWWTNTVLRWGN